MQLSNTSILPCLEFSNCWTIRRNLVLNRNFACYVMANGRSTACPCCHKEMSSHGKFQAVRCMDSFFR